MGAPAKPRLLWFDLTARADEAELRVQSAQFFEVACTTQLERAQAKIEQHNPSVLCFDFDHPDQARLRAMQDIKKSNPRLPILMLTVGHSESLAVWAFRARVWNYLVKPVARDEFAENLEALARIGSRGAPPRVAQTLAAAVPDDLPVQPIEANIARLQPALHFVAQHYHEKLTEAATAKACGMSRFEFSRKFHAAFGMTFREYLLRVRITEARRLLIEGGRSVTNVAYSVGFNDGSHFASMFRRYTGIPPSDYRGGEPSAQQTIGLPVDLQRPVPRRRATDRLKVDRRREPAGPA
jgi:AraC-like DNA-binding protein